MGENVRVGWLLWEESKKHDTQISVGCTFNMEIYRGVYRVITVTYGEKLYEGLVKKLATLRLVDSCNGEKFKFSWYRSTSLDNPWHGQRFHQTGFPDIWRSEQVNPIYVFQRYYTSRAYSPKTASDQFSLCIVKKLFTWLLSIFTSRPRHANSHRWPRRRFLSKLKFKKITETSCGLLLYHTMETPIQITFQSWSLAATYFYAISPLFLTRIFILWKFSSRNIHI